MTRLRLIVDVRPCREEFPSGVRVGWHFVIASRTSGGFAIGSTLLPGRFWKTKAAAVKAARRWAALLGAVVRL